MKDPKGEVVDDGSVQVVTESSSEFSAVLKIEDMKIMDGSYTVEISSAGVCRFSHNTKKITYWIPVQSKQSTFGK